jgi:hypothetical protein
MESGSMMELKSGSVFNVGVGDSVDNLTAAMNIGSSGQMNIHANGQLNLYSSVDDDTNITEHRYEWETFPKSGAPIVTADFASSMSNKTSAYNDAKTRITSQVQTWLNNNPSQKELAAQVLSDAIASLNYYFMVGNKRYEGGKIHIESDNGIEIASGGSIKIGSGSKETVSGNIDIVSNGKIRIGAGAELEIAAGTTDIEALEPVAGKISIASSGVLNMYAGSEMNIGVDDLGEGTAKLNIMSKGEINVKADGSIRIASGGTFTVDSGQFSIDENGNVTMGGIINAAAGGTIGGWSIDENSLFIEKEYDTLTPIYPQFGPREKVTIILNSDVGLTKDDLKTKAIEKNILRVTRSYPNAPSWVQADDLFIIGSNGYLKCNNFNAQSTAKFKSDVEMGPTYTMEDEFETTKSFWYQEEENILHLGRFYLTYRENVANDKYTSMVGKETVLLTGDSTSTTFGVTFHSPSTTPTK